MREREARRNGKGEKTKGGARADEQGRRNEFVVWMIELVAENEKPRRRVLRIKKTL